ncbi:ExbD/TolR family protein [Tenacibaculum maritimum]|uniref:Biopolymer transporter ExbD n=1 Tax=Tenacibaculum maritimum NCIMB 2154 TaxID=1349785 RepID=A0A2H1E6N8_9FLAO|nr:biopolymer transporter ExbD [Tenacibaculum maritimum]MCD9561916.1 biopolymer transporter ExbD [Tenacibaculum maritimum]MCD9564970.1 biopolymer transporter ExbD [Tenacibaculum maritimum]MCD9578943.1 biopolymer transporter ExbD [Tenacibaculum maritimum]MCD9580883.1 biopolymer transporter ExbD [Tenacibaculum maritimum]MCD9584004.1 biopolymer transporter ExbD [Tenacibaculum maritimum]
MSKFKKKKKGLPPVSTASLPDIVFMLLFFFMVTTTMRETDLKIDSPRLPSASEVKKLEHKSLVSTIYVGKAKDPKYGKGYNRIQLNDKIGTPDDVTSFIIREREDKSDAEIPFMTTSIKADKESNVGTLTDIRLKLRDVNALKLSLSTHKGDVIKK